MIIRSDGKTYKSIDVAFEEMRKEDPKFKKYNLKCCTKGTRKTTGGFGWCEGEVKIENDLPRFEANTKIRENCLEGVEKALAEMLTEEQFKEPMVSMSISNVNVVLESDLVNKHTIVNATEEEAEMLKKDFGLSEIRLVNHNPEDSIGTAEVKEIEEGLEVNYKLIEPNEFIRYEPGQPSRASITGSFSMTPGRINATDVERTPLEVKEALRILGIELVQGLGVVFANYIEEGSLRPGYITLKDLSKKLMWNDGKLRGYSRYRQLIGDMPNDIKDKVGSTHVVKEREAGLYIRNLQEVK